MQAERDRLEQALKAAKGDIQAFPLIGQVEKAFDSIGLMRGSFAPLGRAGVGFIVGSGVMFALNGLHLAPWAFDEYGNKRPWKYDDPENGTSVPWWVLPAGFAFVSGVLI